MFIKVSEWAFLKVRSLNYPKADKKERQRNIY